MSVEESKKNTSLSKTEWVETVAWLNTDVN